ncbi:DUF7394 family protein [Metabacillus arenae]|uniref:Uncharacterized protein n=1 Tax=Metabacillus arenae TaxID=2771434 RepID=A0A926RVR9_9BACI|nr:hypothetical protein [Metabacillus arenae]MBD1379186.1 hypothetical protein [Metabacillus arenae]
METALIGIGITILKVCAFGGLGAGAITGIKWFSKFDPSFKRKSILGGGESDSTDLEHLRKKVRQTN